MRHVEIRVKFARLRAATFEEKGHRVTAAAHHKTAYLHAEAHTGADERIFFPQPLQALRSGFNAFHGGEGKGKMMERASSEQQQKRSDNNTACERACSERTYHRRGMNSHKGKATPTVEGRMKVMHE